MDQIARRRLGISMADQSLHSSGKETGGLGLERLRLGVTTIQCQEVSGVEIRNQRWVSQSILL